MRKIPLSLTLSTFAGYHLLSLAQSASTRSLRVKVEVERGIVFFVHIAGLQIASQEGRQAQATASPRRLNPIARP